MLSEIFSHAFMVRALLTGALVGAICAAVGVFVVRRGLSFLGDGLAHAAFGGIALGLLLSDGPEGTWLALPFTVAVALGISRVQRSGRLSGDVATGVFFALSFAMGVLLLSARDPARPAVNIESILFGSILAVTEQDLWVIAGVGLLVILTLGLTWGSLAYATFDRELAELSGVRVARLDDMLFALTAVVIVVSVKTVGVVLVSAFLIIPAATAGLLTRTLPIASLLAIGIGVAGSAAGLIGSYHADVPSGAAIIVVLGAAFFGALPFQRAAE